MAELFNPEQYRQQMSGQAAQGQPLPGPAHIQPYQPQQMQHTQLQQNQIQETGAQPCPYQPQEYLQQPQFQQAAPPYMPPQHQQMQPPKMMQPQTPMHHMPVAPVFMPPPGASAEMVEDAPKTSRFKRKGTAKVKTPKVKKSKTKAAETVHTTKTSPAIIFMFGMATGIVCFLVGNMAMSNLLSDNSAKSFKDIERQNAQAQQPVLPQSTKKSAEATEG